MIYSWLNDISFKKDWDYEEEYNELLKTAFNTYRKPQKNKESSN
jgi:hypothetical protein